MLNYQCFGHIWNHRTQPLICVCRSVPKRKTSGLGFSYRASSMYYNKSYQQMRLFCNIFLFTPSFSYMFRVFTSPSSGVSSAVVYVLPLGSCGALLFVCVRLLCGRRRRRTQTNKKAPHEPSGST